VDALIVIACGISEHTRGLQAARKFCEYTWRKHGVAMGEKKK